MKKIAPQIKTGKRTSSTGLEGLWLEIGMDCDMKCSFCFNNAGGAVKEKDVMKTEDYISLLKQFKEMGGNTVGLPGAGEPFLASNWLITKIIIEYCDKNDIQCVIFTHGLHLTDEIIDFIDKDNVSIALKYNSSSATVQDKIVGVEGYTEKRKAIIEKLKRKGFNKYIDNFSRLAFITPIFEENYDELPDLYRYCRDNQIIPDIDTVLEKGRGTNFDIKKAEEKIKLMFEGLQKIDKEEYGYEWEISPTYVAGCCDRYKRHMYVNRFGVVSPCLGANLSGAHLGNLKEKSLEEMWSSSLMTKVKNKDYCGECVNCQHFKEGTCHSCLGRFVDVLNEEKIHTIGCWHKK